MQNTLTKFTCWTLKMPYRRPCLVLLRSNNKNLREQSAKIIKFDNAWKIRLHGRAVCSIITLHQEGPGFKSQPRESLQVITIHSYDNNFPCIRASSHWHTIGLISLHELPLPLSLCNRSLKTITSDVLIAIRLSGRYHCDLPLSLLVS